MAPGPRWSTSCALSLRGSGRVRWGCSRACTAGSRSRSLSATPAPRTRAAWEKRACTAFLVRQHYTGRQKPAQLLAKLRRAPEARVGELELGHPPSAGPEPGRDDQDDQRADQAARAADRDRHPRAPRRRDLPVAVQEAQQRDHAPRSCWRRSATAARATPPATRSPPTPATPPSRSSPANAKPPASVGPATSACARRSVTLADTTRHHNPWAQDLYAARPRPRARPPPRDPHPRPRLVPHRVALLAGPAPRTTPPATAPCNSTSRSPSPAPPGPSSTTPPPSAWPPAPFAANPSDRKRGDRRTVSSHPPPSLALPAPSTDFTYRHQLTLTVSAARQRWGGRRVPFCAGRAAGRALTLAVAQRAICVRGSPGGPGGCAPGPHAGSARPVNAPLLPNQFTPGD